MEIITSICKSMIEEDHEKFQNIVSRKGNDFNKPLYFCFINVTNVRLKDVRDSLNQKKIPKNIVKI